MNRKQKVAVVVGAVVIVLLALALVTWLLPDELGILRLSDEGQAHFHVAILDACIRMYRVKHERLPPDLHALIETGLLTGEDYIHGIPKDPWGNTCEYEILYDTKYRVLSHGKDGQAGTEDDVVLPLEKSAIEAMNGAGQGEGLVLTKAQLTLVLVIALVLALALTVAAVIVLRERKPTPV